MSRCDALPGPVAAKLAELEARIQDAKRAQALLQTALQCGCVDPLLCEELGENP